MPARACACRIADALRLLTKELLRYTESQPVTAVKAGELFEVNDDG